MVESDLITPLISDLHATKMVFVEKNGIEEICHLLSRILPFDFTQENCSIFLFSCIFKLKASAPTNLLSSILSSLANFFDTVQDQHFLDAAEIFIRHKPLCVTDLILFSKSPEVVSKTISLLIRFYQLMNEREPHTEAKERSCFAFITSLRNRGMLMKKLREVSLDATHQSKELAQKLLSIFPPSICKWYMRGLCNFTRSTCKFSHNYCIDCGEEFELFDTHKQLCRFVAKKRLLESQIQFNAYKKPKN